MNNEGEIFLIEFINSFHWFLLLDNVHNITCPCLAMLNTYEKIITKKDKSKTPDTRENRKTSSPVFYGPNSNWHLFLFSFLYYHINAKAIQCLFPKRHHLFFFFVSDAGRSANIAKQYKTLFWLILQASQ